MCKEFPFTIQNRESRNVSQIWIGEIHSLRPKLAMEHVSRRSRQKIQRSRRQCPLPVLQPLILLEVELSIQSITSPRSTHIPFSWYHHANRWSRYPHNFSFELSTTQINSTPLLFSKSPAYEHKNLLPPSLPSDFWQYQDPWEFKTRLKNMAGTSTLAYLYRLNPLTHPCSHNLYLGLRPICCAIRMFLSLCTRSTRFFHDTRAIGP